MIRSTSRVALLVLAGTLLAACGDDDGGGGNNSGNSGVLRIFGANFDAAFNDGVVDPTADPKPVAEGDIIPVSFTTDPVDIPNP